MLANGKKYWQMLANGKKYWHTLANGEKLGRHWRMVT